MVTIVKPDYEAAMVKENFNVAIKCSQGWLFTKVIEVERSPYEFALWDSIPASSQADFTIPRDADANEILRVERKGVMTQVFQGWNQPRLRVFQRYPQSVPRGVHPNPRIGNPSLATAPTFGWQLEGSESPFDDITSVGQFFILPFMSIEIGFSNPEAFQVTPRNKWLFVNFNHFPYDPQQQHDREVIMGILKGRIPARVWSPGIESFPYPIFEAQFDVKPTQYDGKQAWIIGPGGQQQIIGGV